MPRFVIGRDPARKHFDSCPHVPNAYYLCSSDDGTSRRMTGMSDHDPEAYVPDRLVSSKHPLRW
jgi:hypothetical protein